MKQKYEENDMAKTSLISMIKSSNSKITYDKLRIVFPSSLPDIRSAGEM